MITVIAVATIGLTSIALFAFGANLLYLTWRATRLQPPSHQPLTPGAEPCVCIQVPIYNERYVAERVLDAVCELDWPRDRFEVQVLDDSDDETVSIVARRAAHWRRLGVDVSHVRRPSREGFKAGALAHGMKLTNAPFIAIFDADFTPPRDFLYRMLGVFDDPTIGFAQARWGHLDEGYSWFTRLQAFALDFHFLIEQAARSSGKYFTNFTGTAGVWRTIAIEDSGGWSSATLTEDLELSYRAQLRGWKAAYLEEVVVPEELPVSFDAYRRQQSRWATGSFQSAFRLLVPVLRSGARPAAKVQATMHLLAYGVGPVMALQLACYPLLLLGPRFEALPWQVADAGVLFVMMGISPWIGFSVAQIRRGRPWWAAAPSLLCQLVGAGMSFTVILALFQATRPGGEFVRTPKHQIVERGQEWRNQAYVRVGDTRAIGEALLGAASLTMAPFAAAQGQWLVAVYSTLFALGFLTVAGLTAIDFLEVVTLRSLGRRALARVRVAAPSLGLMALCGVLLLLAAQVPEPFEDGYGHWLIAANLASTGQLKDPLFGMQDTWLPGYHVLAAAVLKIFGLWSLGALKVLGAGMGLATLALVYVLAPNGRQGRLAVALLALNPVFLFTSGSSVVEPLLTALLTACGLAAVRGRMKLAALLAALACVTATKAWIWVGAVVVFVIAEQLVRRFPVMGRRRSIAHPRRVQQAAFAWAIPAVALLIFMQLGFAPASHSLARGTVEVLSATARGNVPADAIGRLIELIGWFGLAALPLFALAAVGLVAALRNSESRRRATSRFLYVPALAYLTAVVGLVTIGAYTGSHRYLYPALPALALLAAGALERISAPLRLAAVSAGGLLAIGFMPVFAGFSSDNSGLIAVGRAASGTPGVLLTDSPVAAFYSGKSPSELTGSQNLPPDRNEAIAWLRANKVTELVLENISYYRATAVFPDLASGNPSPPFEWLGAPAPYRVPSGKPVYAYRFGEGLFTQSLSPGLSAVISPVPGHGKTAGLAKGLSLRVAGVDVSGEGLGFGVPMVHYADGWVYADRSTTVNASTAGANAWKKTFDLNRIGVDATHSYLPIASRGQIQVTYTLDTTGVAVEMRVLHLAAGFTEMGVLNELSASFDNLADRHQTLTGASLSPWVPVDGDWGRLRSAAFGVEWSVPALDGAQLHGGRELALPGFDWAGLDYIFATPPTTVSYHITVQAAR